MKLSEFGFQIDIVVFIAIVFVREAYLNVWKIKRSRDFTHSLILIRFSSTLQLLLSIECCIRNKEILLHAIAKNHFLRTILSNTRFYNGETVFHYLKLVDNEVEKKTYIASIWLKWRATL
ncbi:hypothetical protein T12_16234 [Trichinella patagoniensis]|uniref:Uncharacterized protein n=1 Tax=Trichinella patagoniensis TaxID=990121 RepID=A0A0V0ZZG7_9BILA|nr:hypothetical protein T12_6071 [Trichinella patagoniensis]KRY17981.1 hypothetical protein T12_16234 [Trichinella patagoniensis]